jgi:excisionase family DNA binding protein
METAMENKLLTTKQAAQYLSLSEAFLERDRWAGARIPFVRVGARAVRYELSTLEAYVKSCIRKSTSNK